MGQDVTDMYAWITVVSALKPCGDNLGHVRIGQTWYNMTWTRQPETMYVSVCSNTD